MKYKIEIKDDVISNMFLSAAIAMIFSQVAGVMSNIIDGIITSRFLGADSLSSVSLTGPFISTIILVAGFISTGSQVVCGGLVGVGKRREANSVFSVALLVTLLGAIFFIILCSLFPEVIFRICGVTKESHPVFFSGMVDYLHGYMVGIPAVMLIQILGPFIAMDNGKTYFSISAFILCISDIIGDLLNALIIHGGVFGMGLATTIAFYIQLLFLLCYYLRKNCYFTFSISNIRLGLLWDISKEGAPTLVRKLATVLRDLLVSRINLSVALTGAAVAARAMQNDLNTLMFCIGLGIGKTLLSITGIYYTAGDRKGLTRVFSYSVKISIIISGVASLVLFIFAPLIASLYSNDYEVVSYSVFSIRCMAVSLVLDTLLVTFQNYLQGIRNRGLVNLFNFGERFIIPVMLAFIMGKFFGSKGVLASIAVGKIILIVVIYIFICIYLKRPANMVEDFMFLPKDFGGEKEDNLYASIENMEDVIEVSLQAEKFCKSHGCADKKAKNMACFVEEMAGNIILHGKTKAKRKVKVDFRLHADSNGTICLTLRDYCSQFDPTAFYEAHQMDSDDKYIGIRLVTKMANRIAYFNAFNSNNLMIIL